MNELKQYCVDELVKLYPNMDIHSDEFNKLLVIMMIFISISISYKILNHLSSSCK